MADQSTLRWKATVDVLWILGIGLAYLPLAQPVLNWIGKWSAPYWFAVGLGVLLTYGLLRGKPAHCIWIAPTACFTVFVAWLVGFGIHQSWFRAWFPGNLPPIFHFHATEKVPVVLLLSLWAAFLMRGRSSLWRLLSSISFFAVALLLILVLAEPLCSQYLPRPGTLPHGDFNIFGRRLGGYFLLATTLCLLPLRFYLLQNTHNVELRSLRSYWLVTGTCAVPTALACGFLVGPVIRLFFPMIPAIDGLLGRETGDTVLDYLLFSLNYSWNLAWALLGVAIVLSCLMPHFRDYVSTDGISLANTVVVGLVTGIMTPTLETADMSALTLAWLLSIASMLLAFAMSHVSVTAFFIIRSPRHSPLCSTIASECVRVSEEIPHDSPTSASLPASESPPKPLNDHVALLRHLIAVLAILSMEAGCVAMAWLTTQIKSCSFAKAESLAQFLLFPSMAAGAFVGLLAVSALRKGTRGLVGFVTRNWSW